MNRKRLRRMLLFAVFALFLTATSTDPAEATSLGQRQTGVRDKKTRDVEYVCPMHPEVKSKSAGKCQKCAMTLEKRKTTS